MSNNTVKKFRNDNIGNGIEQYREKIDELNMQIKGLETSLRKSNSEHKIKHKILEEKNKEIERTNLAFLNIMEDLTSEKEALRKIKDELDQAMIKLKETSYAKSMFLANISHEIRTPMNAIVGFSDVLIENQNILPAEMRQVKLIRDSSHHLLTLINDILDYSKFEAGKLSLVVEPFSLHDIVASAINSVSHLITDETELLSHMSKDIPVNVLGDSVRVKQILINLLSNAAKFTKSGIINIFINSHIINPERHQIEVKISDSGFGIPSSRIDSLFNVFEQVDNSLTRTVGGTGLGLAICKKLCQSMQGDISCQSTEGKGSTFSFKIVLQEGGLLSKSDGKNARKTKSLKKFTLKILLAEDNKINQELMEIRLKKMGVSVDIVGDGLQVLEALERNKYDLILMDVHMPKMDGITATKEIRNNSELEIQPKIVALTANALSDDKERGISSGMDDYLTKPLNSRELREMIERYENLLKK